MTALIRSIPPFIQLQTIAAATRQSFAGTVIMRPYWIEDIRVAWALNTQRLLQVSVWVSFDGAPANNVRPTGINLMSGYGARDYIVGDGLDGEFVLPVQRQFPAGTRLIAEGFNTDTPNTHTMNLRVSLADLV